MAVRFIALLLAAGCSGQAPETIEPERSGVGVCSPDGHVISSAVVGERYRATDPAIQSVVVSNGTVPATIDGDAWTFTVADRASTSLPLVIQLRDVDHRTLCSDIEAL